MDYQALKTLVQTHPEWQTADPNILSEWCNEVVVSQDVPTLPVAMIFQAIEPTELQALTPDQREEVWNILHLHAASGVPTASTARARQRLVEIFLPTSVTIHTNLAPLVTTLVSRAAAAGILSRVRTGDVERALAS